MQGMFDDPKGVTRFGKSKKDRQYKQKNNKKDKP